MRLLQMCEAFGGGNFSSVSQICNGLAGRGHEVHLAFSRRAETPPDFERLLHPSIVLHELRMTRGIDPLTDLRSLVATLRLIRRVDPEVIHLHSSKAGFVGRMAAWLLGRSGRVFYSPRGLSFLQRDVSARRRRLFLGLEWLAARLGGSLVACSRGELAEVRDKLAPSRALLIENAVDVAMVPVHVAAAGAAIRVGTLGRITAARNPRLFAALARRLQATGVEFVWIGGGDEPDRALLEQSGVRVTGWLSRAAALECLASLDVYVQASLWEGMPVSVIEAQVAGIPAVVTDILGNRDIVIDGETGFVCPTEDAMVERIGRLIADRATREAFGARSRQLALTRFDVGRLLDELLAAYAAVRR